MSEKSRALFSVPTDTDFHISFLSVNKTKENPDKFFKCTASLRRWERFFYIVDGKITFESNGCLLTAQNGEIVYLPYDVSYTSEWENEAHIDYITVEFILENDKGERVSLSDGIQSILKDKSGIYLEKFKSLYETWEKGEIAYKIKARAQFFELLYSVAVNSVKAELKRNYNSIYKAIMYIENNYIGDISVDELAKMCSMSVSYFRRVFHNYAGMSPIKYKNKLKAEKAAELLSTGEYTVSEAAYLVGINDIAYFNRIFNQVFGRNPGEFKPG
jgi:AraC-like DNA-binding protein